jgi:putative membrane protein
MGPGNMEPIRIDLHTLVRYWLVTPYTCAVLAALVLAAFWYVQAAGDLAEESRPWPAQRTIAFLSGLLAVEVACQSSVAMLPYISFPMHVVQTLLLVIVAAPLLVLGDPVSLALETSSEVVGRRLFATVRSRAVAVLTHPAAATVALYGGLLVYFLTSVLAVSMGHVWLLDLANLALLAVALLFWSGIFGIRPASEEPGPVGPRLAALTGAVVAQSVIAVSLITRAAPAAPIYTLSGTRQGAVALWVISLLVMVAAGCGVLAVWYRSEGPLQPGEGSDPAAPSDGLTTGFRSSPGG